jgi:hypothetical protein
MCLPGPQGPLRLQFPAPSTNPLFNLFFLCPLLREWREESLIFLAEDTFLSAPPTTNRSPPSHRQAVRHLRPPDSSLRLQFGSGICKKELANGPLQRSKQVRSLQTGEPFAFTKRFHPGFETNFPAFPSTENRRTYPCGSAGFFRFLPARKVIWFYLIPTNSTSHIPLPVSSMRVATAMMDPAEA